MGTGEGVSTPELELEEPPNMHIQEIYKGEGRCLGGAGLGVKIYS